MSEQKFPPVETHKVIVEIEGLSAVSAGLILASMAMDIRLAKGAVTFRTIPPVKAEHCGVGLVHDRHLKECDGLPS